QTTTFDGLLEAVPDALVGVDRSGVIRLDRLSAVVEFSGDAIFASTLEGVITSWNPAAERLFGYSSVQIIGRSDALLSPEEQKTEAATVLARVTDGQTVEALRSIRCRRDGSVFMASLTVSPIRDNDGVVIGVSTIVHSARAMKEASEAAQLMSAVIQLSGEAITSAADGVITGWNPAAARLFGY